MKGLFNQSNQIEKNNPIKIIDENHIPISINSNPNKNNFFFNKKKSKIAISYLSIGSTIKKIPIQNSNNLSNQNDNKSQNNKMKYLSFHIKNNIKNTNNFNNTLPLKDSLKSNDNFSLFKEKNSYLKRNIKNKLSKKNLKIQSLKIKIKFLTISTERNHNYSRNRSSNSKSNKRNFSHENEDIKKEKLKINLGNFVKNHNYCKTLINFNNCNKLIQSKNKKNNKSKAIYIKNFIHLNYKSKNKTIEYKKENNKNNSLEYNLDKIKLNLNPILDKISINNKKIKQKNLTNLYERNPINTLENNKNNENNNSFENNKYNKIDNSNKKNTILTSNYKSRSKIKKKINELDNELFNINNLNEPNENYDDKQNDLYSLVKKLPFNSIIVDNEDIIFSQKSVLYQDYFKEFKNYFHKNYLSNKKDKYGNISLSTQQNSTEKKTI